MGGVLQQQDRPVSLRPDVERHQLDAGTWVDTCRGWVSPTDAEELHRALLDTAPWRQARLWRFDHWSVEPRLTAGVRPTAHPVLLAAHKALRAAYGVTFDGPAVGLYRDGRDALGAHRDRELRYTTDTVIAILSLGARRPWVLTPRGAGARTVPTDVDPGPGDLLVLGGRAQVDWLHGVPPVPSLRESRISVQWRWTSGTGPPERGPGYRAPRHYGRG